MKYKKFYTVISKIGNGGFAHVYVVEKIFILSL